ncbi:hypothetical protein LX77_00526 [Gelidibacter algens]|uniref:DUF4129 domain-containing protein n=1 Tax=Gelidibacter algens TaxID=49280 RepID=A0A327SHP0_9FLAO|nr:hypothetical protein [Gelidibacter algens]RAJ27952.1 hypothetical protein LX77_00526 [Gelidibacter algens]
MKLNLTLIFMVCLFLPSTKSTLWATATMQQPQTERQFSNGFKDDYSGRKYDYEGKAKVRSGSTQQGQDAEYSEDQPDIKEDNITNDFSFDLSAFNWLFVLILIFAVGYLAYTLLNEGSSKLFSSRNNEQLKSYSEITAENIAHADIKTLITNAENTNDYRLAIRYYYLLVLKQLTLKNFIKFEDDKTNADYMNAIASQKFSKGFAYTSYLYNYTWYGEFTLDTEQYQLAKNSFVKLINEVNS